MSPILLTLNWTAIVAFAVFILTQLFNSITRFREKQSERRAIARGLIAEMTSVIQEGGEAKSVDGFDKFIDTVSVEDLNAFSFVATQFPIYAKFVDRLGVFDADIVLCIVRFYSLAHRMNALIVHFKTPEFVSSNHTSKTAMIKILKQTNRHMHSVSVDTLAKLKRCSG